MKASDHLAPLVAGAAAVLLALSDYHCPILALTGSPCPGCGITRAFFALLRLDFAAAAAYNPMIFPLIGAVPVVWYGLQRKKGARWPLTVLLILAIGWWLWFYFK